MRGLPGDLLRLGRRPHQAQQRGLRALRAGRGGHRPRAARRRAGPRAGAPARAPDLSFARAADRRRGRARALLRRRRPRRCVSRRGSRRRPPRRATAAPSSRPPPGVAPQVSPRNASPTVTGTSTWAATTTGAICVARSRCSALISAVSASRPQATASGAPPERGADPAGVQLVGGQLEPERGRGVAGRRPGDAEVRREPAAAQGEGRHGEGDQDGEDDEQLDPRGRAADVGRPGDRQHRDARDDRGDAEAVARLEALAQAPSGPGSGRASRPTASVGWTTVSGARVSAQHLQQRAGARQGGAGQPAPVARQRRHEREPQRRRHPPRARACSACTM